MSLAQALSEPLQAPVAPLRRTRPAEAPEVVVLKFGSSILGSPADVPAAVSEVYRHVREGRRVVAVVSAFSGHTDQLFGQARSLGIAHDNRHLPRYVALGEEKAASLVAIGCDRVGLTCVALTVKELGLVGRGPVEDAWPVRLDCRSLEAALVAHDVVVVPGFGAVDETGGVVLLGRGGSDLTAVFIAAELGLDRVRLVKDVDGVYEDDPNQGDDVLRYDRLSWDRARAVAGKLVQPRAIDVAEARGVTIEVSALGRERASVIAPQDRPPSVARKLQRHRVAVAGCGVVGGGVLQRLLADPERFEVVGVLVRDPAKARDVDVPAHLLTSDAAELLARKPDLLVEALSEGEAGERLLRAALEAGVDVVSANKQALAGDLPGLRRLAQRQGARLLYSAAVGGGSPIVETVRAARASGEVVAVEAVLNGTVNFVIDRLSQGATFDDALAQARAAGFAEEDPSSDLEGWDAAAKLRILAYEAFGETLEGAIPLAVLDSRTPRSPDAWASVKQVARCRRTRDGLSSEVTLEATTEGSPFRHLRGERNAVHVLTADGQVFTCRGRGAGRWPTTESVYADVMSLQRADERI
jgi:homoserine dehydrogenase